jgi:hypothetical protein
MRVPISVSRRLLRILLLAGIVLVPVALLRAQEAEPSVSAPNYDLSWWTVDGGGSTEPASSQSYSLVGTIGQADAGEMRGTDYGFVGGFWAIVPAGISPADHHIYLPLVVRNTP